MESKEPRARDIPLPPSSSQEDTDSESNWSTTTGDDISPVSPTRANRKPHQFDEDISNAKLRLERGLGFCRYCHNLRWDPGLDGLDTGSVTLRDLQKNASEKLCYTCLLVSEWVLHLCSLRRISSPQASTTVVELSKYGQTFGLAIRATSRYSNWKHCPLYTPLDIYSMFIHSEFLCDSCSL